MLTLLWLLPYLFAVSVSTEMELRKALNNGRDVTLNEDIILKLPWMPIPAYGKVFDGNGHTIRNISVSSDVPASQGSGLFSELTGGSISNLNLQFNTTIDNGLILFGGVSAKASNKVRITNVNISGTVSIKSHADGNVTAGCVFGTAGDTGVREPSDAVRSDCIITVNASNASLRLGGFIGVLENNAVTMYYTGKPHVGCYAKRCYIGGFASMATGPVQDIHFTDSVVNATALRHSIVGGIVGHGSNIQLCSSYNVTISVTSTGRVLSGVSVGGAVGETNTENYVINTTFIKASMIILETRSSSYLGGVLGYGKHGGGTITNSYAVIQSLRGYNNGGHMYGGGFLGYGNASSLTLSTCYMFVPEFQFFEKPGAGGHSYYGGFFGLINGSSSDTPSIHSIQAGMGKFEVRMVAQKTNAGNFGGAIEAARTTLLERIVLMGAAGIWSGEAPENAAIFIGKMGPGISLKTILVNISIGNGNDLPNTANFVNTFDGTATDIVYNSGVVKTSQFMPTTGTYKHFNIRVNTTTQVSCESYLKKYGLDSSKVNCADDLYLNKTPSNSQINTDWTFETLDNWEHDPKGWYLPKGMPVANSEINSPALFMTIYLDAKGRTDLSWQQSGWDNGTVWRFGNTNKTDTAKAIPPSFPALWKNPESFLACAPQDCGRESFFSPFMCNCLHGCPGLKNGQCSSYNGATCDEGWKNVGTSLCSGFSCTSKNQLCGDGQVAECDAGSSLCKCKEHEKYYNISTKTCEMGCQGIGHGFCTGPGVAMCDKGWTDGESGLCTVYSCSSDDPATACGGSSVATCVTAYDTCKCTVQTSAYNPANRQCEPNKCAIASGDHICIGENKAICMSNTWPASGASSETLCAHYDCTRHQQCAAGSICDIETFACRCANPAQYFDIADNTCKDGCTDLNTHTGVCIGTNKALCYKGYTSPNSGKPLCSQYSCTDIDPTCGGHGTCSGGTCTCNEGALKFNNTCYANICIQGTVSSQDVCTCNSGWQDDPTLSPLKCTKPSTCPDSININSDVDLIYLYSCGSSTYNLLANVTVSYPWLPVPSFVGVFNGNGHTLKEVRLYENDTIAALFKAIDENARITNLIIEFATSFSSSTIKKVAGLTLDLNGEVLMNVTAAGSIFVKAGVTEVDVGGLASTCTGLRNVTFLGHLAVESHSTVRMGALCASASSPLSDLATDGSISCTSRGRCLVGGLVSSTTHNISSSSSIISITVSSANGLVGGMVSNTTGNLTDLTFKGTVLSPLDSTDIVGGIAGVAKPQLSQLLTVRKCNVVSKAISASSAGGLVGAIEAGVIEESSVTLTAFEGSICAGGLVCNATNTTIAKSNSNIDALRFTANYAEELAKQYCGGFIANATEATIEDSYSVVTISAVKTSSEAFVGGFVGGANELTVKRSYTSGDSVNLVPDNILHFGGFVGSCICNIDSSFSKIALMALNKGKINNAHFGGFVGIIKRTSVREDRAVSTSPQISSSWASSSMSVLLSNPEASRVFYGGFSGEADASTIIDSYTRSNLSVNNDINLYHTGFGAFNGRFNELETNITRCYADVGIDGATDLNFEGNSAYGKRCVKCTRVLINNDQPGISDEDACGRTAVELQKSETIMKAFGSIDAFAFVPGRMPMIVTTPNLDSVTHTYAYPSCNPSTQGNCWDYKDIWIVSPDGIGSAATAPGCKVSSCTYCDARDSGVCRICASQTFLDSRKTCSVCSSSCAECATRESFCTACKRTGAMPDMNGVCIMPRLSSAAIAGISIVVILVVSGVVGFLCWWFICRSKGNPIEKPAHTLEPSVSTVGISASIL